MIGLLTGHNIHEFIPTRHGCNYNCQQSYKISFLWFHISWINNSCFNDIFATDIQPITVRKIITFLTESCFPEAYCHHKCPMGRTSIFGVLASRLITNSFPDCSLKFFIRHSHWLFFSEHGSDWDTVLVIV